MSRQGRQALLLAALTVALLVPFLGKPLHVDDPLFVWTAERILAHPLDPYGFRVNWYEWDAPMHEVTKNPPLAAYALALVGAVAGFGEVGLHLAFLLPAVAVVLGTARLAGQMGAPPGLAGALVLGAPAFLVSATTLMADVLLLALWVWALALWHEGLERGRLACLGGAAVLTAAACLTKYFGASLVLLLVVAWLARRPARPARLLLFVLLPVAVLAAYQWATLLLYGRGLFGDAGSYAASFRAGSASGLARRLLVTASFTGGGLAVVACYAGWLWPRRLLAAAAALGAVGVLALPAAGVVRGRLLLEGHGIRWSLLLQTGLWVLVGVGVAALAVDEVRRRRDPGAWLLGLWVIGTLAFAALFNWTVNARTVLPMAPAVALLLVRRLEARGALAGALRGWRAWAPLLPALALGVGAAWADAALAGSARQAAQVVAARARAGPGQVWFQGHWGFQYYLAPSGARPIDIRRSRVVPGDLIVAPVNNTNPLVVGPGALALRGMIEVPSSRAVATMDQRVGAGFYSDVFGPVPFVLGPVAPERYAVLEARRELGPSPAGGDGSSASPPPAR